jgi:hypothetical protein
MASAVEKIKEIQSSLSQIRISSKHLVLLSAKMSLVIFQNGLIKFIDKDAVDEGIKTLEIGNGLKIYSGFANNPRREAKLAKFFYLWDKARLIGGLHCKASFLSGDEIEYRYLEGGENEVEMIKCHFCEEFVPYPSEIGISQTCQKCKAIYTAELEDDAFETICDSYRQLTGEENVIEPPKIEEKIEVFVEHEVDSLFEDEEEAGKCPDDGIKVSLVWARLRPDCVGTSA